MGSKVETLAQCLQRQRRSLSLTGVLDIPGAVILPRKSPLAALGSLKPLTELHLPNTPLKSFESLLPQPGLKVLIANDSQIESLVGLNRHKWIATLSLINTPIAQQEFFRLTALLVVGQHLTLLNGQPVTPIERKMAISFPPIARKLAAAGWMAQFPAPSELDFQYLARQFGIRAQDNDYVPGASPPTSPVKGEQPPVESERFSEKVAAILRPLGFGIRPGKNMAQDICNAITRMCEVVQKVESLDQGPE
jgi:hypothetical protein